MAAIVIMKGPGAGDYYPLVTGANLVGRSPELAINLRDMTVSRRHLRIVMDPEGPKFRAEDLGSTHGMRVNGVRFTDGVDLMEGDCISAGRVDLMFTRRDITSRDEAFALLESQQSELATINFTDSSVQGLGEPGAVSARRRMLRFLQWAGSPRTTLAVVFTDLVSSTEMTSSLGNEAMDAKRRAHYERVRKLVNDHNGYEIKGTGDGFLIAFHAAVLAVDFALGLWRDPGDPSLRVRVGAHVGPVVIEDEDVQGAAVSYAARLLDLGREGGIWLSAEVKGHLDQEKAARHEKLAWRSRSDVELKGFPGPQVLWTPGGGAVSP
jgi:class 3 adenylate cyclase